MVAKITGSNFRIRNRSIFFTEAKFGKNLRKQ